ncbi:NAD(P)-binding protein [Xylariaceae sp. FL0804]|nr:NAD(P)-binding protein [Xylariaceae sp. FL0804]
MPPPKGTYNPIEGPGDYDTTSVIHNDSYPAIDPAKVDLTGRAVFIAGASRGLGRAMSISFAKSGASMIAIGARGSLSETAQGMREAAAGLGRPEPSILELKLDLASRSSIDQAAAQIKQTFGRLDIVIHNAGVMGGLGPIAESDPDEWWKTWEINVRGPYLVMHAMVPLMLEAGGGLKTFVTVGSVGAHVVVPGLSVYQVAKLAVLRLTQFLNAEYADQDILAYTIHPGNILTDMGAEVVTDAYRPIFTETPKLSGDSLVYLTSERRDWLGGRYINVTWDLPELMAMKEEIVNEDKLKVRLVV